MSNEENRDEQLTKLTITTTTQKVSSTCSGHVWVDDESWIPGVAPTFGPNQVQRFQWNV